MATKTDTQTFMPLGDGARYMIQDSTLLIAIAITPEARNGAKASKSGKTKLLASTGGFAPIPGGDGVKVGLNVTLPL